MPVVPSFRRWWLLLVVLLPLLLAGGHTLLWGWMAAQIEEAFGAWAEARRAQGWTIAHGLPERGGWPFAATLHLPELRFSGASGTVPGGLEWTAEALTLRVALPNLGQLEVEAEGFQRLRLGEIETPFIADRLFATFALEPGVAPRDGRFGADRLRIGLPAGALEIGAATGSFELRMSATEAEPAVLIGLEARNIRLPVATPFGPIIALVETEVALTGPVPGGRQPTRRAAAWRDSGGTLDLRSLGLRWGPLTLESAATLALDEGLQPMGAGTLRVSGAAEVVAALAESGAVSSRAALGAQALIAFTERPGSDGAPAQVDLPLMLDNRTLSVARIPLTRLPPLVWITDPAEQP